MRPLGRQRAAYLMVASALFLVLTAIALWATGIVRTHGGDLLVVAWLYALGRAAFLMSPLVTAIGVVGVAFAIELGQAFSLIERLGLGGSETAALALGRQFDPFDLLAYALGGAGAFAADRLALGRL